ncbi:hypothetical protein GCM10007301_41250 [Azorhizobium oxalatiphilum]|uniref:Uncharacterized protein n=1 Tax=Azorhizobium oxalatiphilum TaxID=980631 RepID=A0A917CA25_9HYPH|nr:hypothetical protein GCM10007301_41250 [Azorhizobium oxalatiphilum]
MILEYIDTYCALTFSCEQCEQNQDPAVLNADFNQRPGNAFIPLKFIYV